MDAVETLAQARDAMSVQRVFGTPYQQDGLTMIPVARVRGGAGAGSGEMAQRKAGDMTFAGEEGGQGEPQHNGAGKGSGGGFGLAATPVGAYEIRGGRVRWRPSVDVNRAILGAQVVAIVALLVVRAIVKSRAGK